jgi:hypothetical protein
VLGPGNAVSELAVSPQNTKEYITMRIMLMKFFGIAFVVLGIVAFAYRGIPYTSREPAMDSDPVKATYSQKVIPISPLLIGLALVSGAALIRVGVLRDKAS